MPKFARTKSGNPAGRPLGATNRATRDVKAICAELVDDPAYRRNLRARLLRGTLAPAVELLLWHYAHGKPKDTVRLEGALLPDYVAVRESLARKLGVLTAQIAARVEAES